VWDGVGRRIKEVVFLLKARGKRSSCLSSSVQAIFTTDIVGVLGCYVRGKARRCDSVGTRLAYWDVVFRIEDKQIHS
jgi:hypothetical protein